jgi:hypothetical protein
MNDVSVLDLFWLILKFLAALGLVGLIAFALYLVWLAIKRATKTSWNIVRGDASVTAIVSFVGSVQESVRAPDFSGFGRWSLSAARRRLRCGNVGTRVWCGFPSSVGRATIFCQDSALGPTERHFHSELGILPISVNVVVGRLHKTKMCVSRNPRRTNIFTDCRAEPFCDCRSHPRKLRRCRRRVSP